MADDVRNMASPRQPEPLDLLLVLVPLTDVDKVAKIVPDIAVVLRADFFRSRSLLMGLSCAPAEELREHFIGCSTPGIPKIYALYNPHPCPWGSLVRRAVAAAVTLSANVTIALTPDEACADRARALINAISNGYDLATAFSPSALAYRPVEGILLSPLLRRVAGAQVVNPAPRDFAFTLPVARYWHYQPWPAEKEVGVALHLVLEALTAGFRVTEVALREGVVPSKLDLREFREAGEVLFRWLRAKGGLSAIQGALPCSLDQIRLAAKATAPAINGLESLAMRSYRQSRSLLKAGLSVATLAELDRGFYQSTPNVTSAAWERSLVELFKTYTRVPSKVWLQALEPVFLGRMASFGREATGRPVSEVLEMVRGKVAPKAAVVRTAGAMESRP